MVQGARKCKPERDTPLEMVSVCMYERGTDFVQTGWHRRICILSRQITV